MPLPRLEVPEAITETYDFTLDALCRECPLRFANPRFQPGYGIEVGTDRYSSDSGETVVDITDLAIEFEMANRLYPKYYTTNETIISTARTASAEEVKAAFEQCKEPAVRERRILPDQKRCGALALLLANSEQQRIRVKSCERNAGRLVRAQAITSNS